MVSLDTCQPFWSEQGEKAWRIFTVLMCDDLIWAGPFKELLF